MNHCIFRFKIWNILFCRIRRNIFYKFFLNLFRRCLLFFHEIFIFFFLISVEDISDSFGDFLLKTFSTLHIALINRHTVNYRSFLFCRSCFFFFFFQLLCIFHRSKFRNKLTVIFFLFLACQHSHSILEIQRLYNIFSIAEPQNHLITECQTFLCISILIIQFCQFI